ncbi:MAG: transcriptional regulator [Candidatus Aminicenantes bacterium]|nr:transcriptional regulator [Candidatus Aminicenantes bacterium]
MSDAAWSVGDFDRLIHEPARLVIVTILNAVAAADFLYLQRETGLTKGNLSAHLAKLEEAGYISIEKTYRGKIPLTVCRLSGNGRAAFRRYREHWRVFVTTTGTKA